MFTVATALQNENTSLKLELSELRGESIHSPVSPLSLPSLLSPSFLLLFLPLLSFLFPSLHSPCFLSSFCPPPPPLPTSLDHFTSLQGQHNDALQTVQEQKNLIGRLETDIMHVQPYLPTRTEGEGQASPSSAEIISEALRDVQLETQRSSSKLFLHRSFQPHSQALQRRAWE